MNLDNIDNSAAIIAASEARQATGSHELSDAWAKVGRAEARYQATRETYREADRVLRATDSTDYDALHAALAVRNAASEAWTAASDAVDDARAAYRALGGEA